MATGRSPSRTPAAAPCSTGGFTLVEILVVVVIIGILSVGAVLSLGVVGGGDRELERERDRIVAVTDYLREQTQLQNREFGMRVFTGGYEFLSWDGRTARWESVQDDPLLRLRELPAGLETRVLVEGRPVVLPARESEDPTPQILLFSSGELNSFELTLLRPQAGTDPDRAPAEIFSPDMQTMEIRVRSAAPGAS